MLSSVSKLSLRILQSDSQLQAMKAREAIHGFVCIPMAIKITRF